MNRTTTLARRERERERERQKEGNGPLEFTHSEMAHFEIPLGTFRPQVHIDRIVPTEEGQSRFRLLFRVG